MMFASDVRLTPQSHIISSLKLDCRLARFHRFLEFVEIDYEQSLIVLAGRPLFAKYDRLVRQLGREPDLGTYRHIINHVAYASPRSPVLLALRSDGSLHAAYATRISELHAASAISSITETRRDALRTRHLQFDDGPEVLAMEINTLEKPGKVNEPAAAWRSAEELKGSVNPEALDFTLQKAQSWKRNPGVPSSRYNPKQGLSKPLALKDLAWAPLVGALGFAVSSLVAIALAVLGGASRVSATIALVGIMLSMLIWILGIGSSHPRTTHQREAIPKTHLN